MSYQEFKTFASIEDYDDICFSVFDSEGLFQIDFALSKSSFDGLVNKTSTWLRDLSWQNLYLAHLRQFPAKSMTEHQLEIRQKLFTAVNDHMKQLEDEMVPEIKQLKQRAVSDKKQNGKAAPEPDYVNHPPHYTNGGIEVIDFIVAWNMSFSEGNVIKYVTRHKYKGTALQDLKKARFYLDKLIEQREVQEEEEKRNTKP